MTTSDRKAFEAALRVMEAKLAEWRGRVVACEEAVKLLKEMLDAEWDAPKPRIMTPAKRGAAKSYEESKAQLGLDASPSSEPGEAESPNINPVTGAEDNSKLTALDEGAIAIGKSLGQPFTTTDLRARLDGNAQRCYKWVAAWKNKGWIETAGFGQYRRTKEFGE